MVLIFKQNYESLLIFFTGWNQMRVQWKHLTKYQYCIKLVWLRHYITFTSKPYSLLHHKNRMWPYQGKPQQGIMKKIPASITMWYAQIIASTWEKDGGEADFAWLVHLFKIAQKNTKLQQTTPFHCYKVIEYGNNMK